MRTIVLKSPAKLNLILKVVGKRDDGFHELVTLFERINLCDEIRLKNNPTGQIRIFCSHPHVPKGSRNLVYKVAQLLQQDFGLANGVDIAIKKQIPIAAGLAGGSSNAATVLRGLNELWGLKLNRKELIHYAQIIGSDVAFFLYDRSWALGTGRGDRIRQIAIQPKFWHVLVVPCIKMHSKQIFTNLHAPTVSVRNLGLTKIIDGVNILIRHLRRNDLQKAGTHLFNDLEIPILRMRPELARLKSKLRGLRPYGTVFSGSGPAIFALTESEKQAQGFRALLKRYYHQVFVVRTL